MNILDLQNALAAAGFDPGPLDGVNGPMTRRAVLAFQRARGLEVDGIVGPNTRRALFGQANAKPDAGKAIPFDLPWLVEAARLRGIKEKAGDADNPVIMNWAEALQVGGFAGDEVPWCGLFTGHCIRAGLPEEPMPANILGARQWQTFGASVIPQFGAVMVFWRGSPEGWMGHVGFYWAEDATHYHILGGNQSNQVNLARLNKDRLLKARWPLGAAPLGIIRHATAAGVLESVSEA